MVAPAIIQSEIVIRKTPFLFLKRVGALIFFFALLPAFVAALLDFRSEYQASALAGIVPNYTLFVVLLLALATKYVQTRFSG